MTLGEMSVVPSHQSVGQRQATWTALIIIGSAGFSLLFACATPFAALVTLAGLKMNRREAAAVIGLVWLCNQLIGYGVLGYPRTWESLTWGLAIGLSVYLALGAATVLSPARPVRFAISLPFVGAFATYEFGLYLAGFVLPGTDGAFAIAIVRQIFTVNLFALIGLLALYQVATFTRLLARLDMLPSGVSVS